MPVFRSLLFAPGNHARRVEKALTLDSDVVILDLEDAVATSEKPATREKVVAAFQAQRRALGYVRVNAFDTPFCFDDLQAVVSSGVDGIVLPKVESPAQLVAVDWAIAAVERDRGLAEGGIDLLPIIETGRGMAELRDIVRSGTRVRRLSFGAGDYTLDVGMRWTFGERELDHARAAIVVESRAAGLEPPIDTVFIHLGMPEALRHSTELARDLGFQGKLCIHPEQIGPVNEAFTPTDGEIAESERYVAAFEEAEASGSASIQVDGYFIDYPIVEKARRTLRIAESIRKRGAGEAETVPAVARTRPLSNPVTGRLDVAQFRNVTHVRATQDYKPRSNAPKLTGIYNWAVTEHGHRKFPVAAAIRWYEKNQRPSWKRPEYETAGAIYRGALEIV